MVNLILLKIKIIITQKCIRRERESTIVKIYLGKKLGRKTVEKKRRDELKIVGLNDRKSTKIESIDSSFAYANVLLRTSFVYEFA